MCINSEKVELVVRVKHADRYCDMITKTVVVTEEQIKENDSNAISIIIEAGTILKNGGLVAFPTETVYGLGGDALNPASSDKIYRAKGRPSDNPLIIHIASIDNLKNIAENIPGITWELAKNFWPGPLTMIFQKKGSVPLETTGGLETVAVRIPRHRTALALIEAAGGYIAAPSANLSGKPSPTLAKYVQEDLDGRIDMIIDGGTIEIGLESTIIDLTQKTPMILRPGFVTKEMIESVIGKIETDITISEENSKQAPRAPGMKYRHYAPKGEMTIIEGDSDKVIAYINEVAQKEKIAGKRVGVIATQGNFEQYEASYVKCLGNKQDVNKIARELYRVLREFDDEDVEIILSESFSDTGMGQAIMNRLLKAAGHKKIKV